METNRYQMLWNRVSSPLLVMVLRLGMCVVLLLQLQLQLLLPVVVVVQLDLHRSRCKMCTLNLLLCFRKVVVTRWTVLWLTL